MGSKVRLIEQVGRSARLRVLNEIKRTQGLCVTDLAERLQMSYMGVKGVCLDLEKRGLLDTWRQPRERGRPQLLYRLTSRAHELYPTVSNAATIDLLEAAQTLFGGTAPEKLLLLCFQKKTESYRRLLRGDSVAERAKALARMRDQDGHMAEWLPSEDGTWCILEHHSPMRDLLHAYPSVAKLEAEMFTRLLGVPIRREEQNASGLFCARFFAGG